MEIRQTKLAKPKPRAKTKVKTVPWDSARYLQTIVLQNPLLHAIAQ